MACGTHKFLPMISQYVFLHIPCFAYLLASFGPVLPSIVCSALASRKSLSSKLARCGSWPACSKFSLLALDSAWRATWLLKSKSSSELFCSTPTNSIAADLFLVDFGLFFFGSKSLSELPSQVQCATWSSSSLRFWSSQSITVTTNQLQPQNNQ